jgi:hypothetical protein
MGLFDNEQPLFDPVGHSILMDTSRSSSVNAFTSTLSRRLVRRSWKDRRSHQSISVARDEGGAILILALVFILLISFSVLGLLTFGGTGIKDSASLQGQRSLEYAADGATTAAIQAVRYSYYAFNGTPGPQNNFTNPAGDCLPDGAVMTVPDTQTLTINGVTMTVDCTGSLYTIPVPQQNTRIVTFYACQQSSCTSDNAVLAATVAFQDLSTAGIYDCYDAPDSASCGTAMIIQSWTIETSND